jgi:kynurenine formamidase
MDALSSRLPRYRDLPIDPSKPPRSAWGVFGDDDEVGTINLLTPERVRRAAGLVRKGAVFSLNWELDKPSPPLFRRGALRHSIVDFNPGTDDIYDNFYPQTSSHWDALAHVGHPEYDYYNGRTRAEITGRPGSRLGIDHWARRGIVGRYVLADVARYRAAQGAPIAPDEPVAITVDELDATLAWQGVALEGGDVLLLRVGWLGWYEQVDRVRREELSAHDLFPCPGLDARERTAEWLWDHHVAAVAADSPAIEALPFDKSHLDGFLHYRAVCLLGIAFGELFVLDALAADCAADGVFDGLFTAAPLNKIGGSGSSANALALK